VNAYNLQAGGHLASSEHTVNLLQKFEQSIERLMEGTTGSLFKQSIQPAEIGKRLERAMLAGQRASMGTALVPNQYVVGLHPTDFSQFKDYRGGLSRQLEAWLAQVATQRNLSVIDRIRVTIEEDPRAKRRNPAIVATIADSRGVHRGPAEYQAHPERRPTPAPAPAPAQQTSVFRAEVRQERLSASLQAVDGPDRGRTYIVPPGETTVGRSPDNDIVLDSPDVSRRHARLECTPNGVRVLDLNSTNGTRVNGEPVRISDLDQGDEIAFGGVRTTIAFHRDPGGD
jgi:hypothetical protein